MIKTEYETYNPAMYLSDSKEYRNLELAAAMMTYLDPYNDEFVTREYRVSTCIYDLGQKWYWTTITVNYDGMDCQALYPRQQGEIVRSKSLDEIAAIVKRYFK